MTKSPVTLSLIAALVAISPITADPATPDDVGLNPVQVVVPSRTEPDAGSRAAFILQYDDDEVDNAYRCVNQVCEIVQLFDNLGGGDDLYFGGLDVCLTRNSGTPSSLDFEMVLFESVGGVPGDIIGAWPANATSIPVYPSVAFYSINANYNVTQNELFAGIRWADEAALNKIFACADDDGGILQPGYLRRDLSGGWTNLVASFPLHDAMMFRAFLSTPGVVYETHTLPFFSVDTLGASTTLFAVRNIDSSFTSVDINYYDTQGNFQMMETADLDPDEVFTRNLRDLPGLATDPDGVKRGWAEMGTGGYPDGTQVLAGDFFQVDTDNNFATGDRLLRGTDICQTQSARLLNFGSGTTLRVFLRNPPGGTPGIDPEAFSVVTYDQTGAFHDAHTFWSDENVVTITDGSVGTISFGTVVFDFSNSGGGYVYPEYSSEGRFSVGLGSECESP